MNTFARLISDKTEEYIKLRRSLGYVFQTQAATLRAFCHFIEDGNHLGPLTGDLALAFVLSCDVTTNVCAWRYGVLRRFAEYFSVFDVPTQRFEPHALPRSRAIPPAQNNSQTIMTPNKLLCGLWRHFKSCLYVSQQTGLDHLICFFVFGQRNWK